MKKDAPNIYHIDNLLRSLQQHQVQCEVKPGKWVPARPCRIGGFRQRLKAAWMVFTGQADALEWRGQ